MGRNVNGILTIKVKTARCAKKKAETSRTATGQEIHDISQTSIQNQASQTNGHKEMRTALGGGKFPGKKNFKCSEEISFRE
jgi:hypothetical protein